MFEQSIEILKNSLIGTSSLFLGLFGVGDATQTANISQSLEEPEVVMEEQVESEAVSEENESEIATTNSLTENLSRNDGREATVSASDSEAVSETEYFERTDTKQAIFSRTSAVSSDSSLAQVEESPRIVNPIKTETEEQKVDASLLLNTNLDTFDIALALTEITENEDVYFVKYEYKIFKLEDYTWVITTKKASLTIPKNIVKNDDLEQHLAKELNEVKERVILDLRELQFSVREKQAQQEALAQVTTATKFSNLIGKLDLSKKASVSTKKETENTEVTTEQNVETVVEETNTNTTEDSEAPLIILNGLNPSLIQIGSSYSDLGARAVDNVSDNLTVVTGGDIVDTETAGSYFVTYTAKDEANNTATATREVIVYDYGEAPEVEQVVQEDPSLTEPTTETESNPVQEQEEPTTSPDTATTTEEVITEEETTNQDTATTTEQTTETEDTATSTAPSVSVSDSDLSSATSTEEEIVSEELMATTTASLTEEQATSTVKKIKDKVVETTTETFENINEQIEKVQEEVSAMMKKINVFSLVGNVSSSVKGLNKTMVSEALMNTGQILSDGVYQTVGSLADKSYQIFYRFWRSVYEGGRSALNFSGVFAKIEESDSLAGVSYVRSVSTSENDSSFIPVNDAHWSAMIISSVVFLKDEAIEISSETFNNISEQIKKIQEGVFATMKNTKLFRSIFDVEGVVVVSVKDASVKVYRVLSNIKEESVAMIGGTGVNLSDIFSSLKDSSKAIIKNPVDRLLSEDKF